MAVKNKNALAHYRKVLDEVRAKHPNMAFRKAQKLASETMHKKHSPVSGAGKKTGKKVSGKKTVGKRTTEVFVIPGAKKSYRVKPGGPTARAIALQRAIDRLEKQRSQQKSKQVKDVFSLAINEKHKQLRDIQKSLRARS